MKRDRRRQARRPPTQPAAIVILDATVPLNFARVDRIDLLGRAPVSLHVGRIVANAELRHWPKASRRSGQAFDVVTELADRIVVTEMETDEELALFARCRSELRLGPGESECVAIASERSWVVATDDGHARRILARHGVLVELTGTVGLLRALVTAGVVAEAEAVDLVDAMKRRGGRLP